MPDPTKAELGLLFEQMAAALELLGGDPFRVNAHARVARLIDEIPDDIDAQVKADPKAAMKTLCAIQGIGKGSAERIVEYFQTGRIAEHDELVAKVPPGLMSILEVPGLGPKTVKVMWETLGITTLEDLKQRLDTDEFKQLPRMGAKTIENIRKAIAFAETSHDRHPLGLVYPLATQIVEQLREVPGAKQVDFAGSVRRGKETIGDIDILASGDDAEALRECFCSFPGVAQTLARGETKCSVRLETKGVAIQADLRIVPRQSYGAALLYFTGSKEHNVRLRERAIKRKMRLNEYGLFKSERAESSSSPAGVGDDPARSRPVAGATEPEVYKALGLEWIPPELREERWEIGAPIPRLVEIGDIKAELHAHTKASDGRLTIDELAACAKARGFHTIAVTDHSRSSVVANGLEPDRLRRHIDAVHEANERTKGITILAGSEVDILPDGRLDYDDELLAELDLVVASPHSSLRQEPKTATARLLRAIENPFVHILGHPTGRMFNSREGFEPDIEQIVAAAKEHDVVLEINANWRRLDLRDVHARTAVEHGCLLAINTDAHSEKHFGFLIYGVLTARRGGVTPECCINTWTARKLHSWLKRQR